MKIEQISLLCDCVPYSSPEVPKGYLSILINQVGCGSIITVIQHITERYLPRPNVGVGGQEAS